MTEEILFSPYTITYTDGARAALYSLGVARRGEAQKSIALLAEDPYRFPSQRIPQATDKHRKSYLTDRLLAIYTVTDLGVLTKSINVIDLLDLTEGDAR